MTGISIETTLELLALGVIAAGYQSADGAIIPPGARGCFGGLVPGRTTRR